MILIDAVHPQLAVSLAVSVLIVVAVAWFSHAITGKERQLILDYKPGVSSARGNLRRRNSFGEGTS